MIHVVYGAHQPENISRLCAIHYNNPVPVLLVRYGTRFAMDRILDAPDNGKAQCIRVPRLNDIPENLVEQHPAIFVESARLFEDVVPFCESHYIAGRVIKITGDYQAFNPLLKRAKFGYKLGSLVILRHTPFY